mgnify:CR=1 FL=1
MITLFHCSSARSFRPLWTLEEIGIPYELKMLPFPPRFLKREYLELNPLGTIPFLIDGEARLSESSAICQYLGETYGPTELIVKPGEKDYAAYLNWMFFSDATATFPQTLVLRYTQLEPEERRVPQIAEDYRKWFLGRMRFVDQALDGRDYLAAGRFTAADITVGYAVYLARRLNIHGELSPRVLDWFARITAREAFQRADARGERLP